ncbi:MAG: OPT family oligopeptide transporter [Acidobacteriota bacterium]
MTNSHDSLAEFTLKAVVVGVLLGILFGAANAYLGLRVGMTVSASIPAAVMTVAIFRLLQRQGTILEANLSQTIGSASTALATGTIFTIPALFLWGMIPPYLQVAALSFLGGVLGLAAMIPLRRLLIVEAHAELPYPEGTACAEVLRATAAGATGGGWIFRGMLVGGGVKLLVALASLLPSAVELEIPILPKAQVAVELAPALLGVGFILGYRQSGVLVAGSVLSSLALIPLIAWMGAGLQSPLFPETGRLVSDMSAADIWSRYVRYIGAGAVATAGIVTVLRGLPTMARAFAAVARGVRRQSSQAGGENVLRTDRDLPGFFVLGVIAFVVVVTGLVPGIFAGNMGLAPRLVCAAGVGLFGLLFVAVAARIVGIVGVSSQPTSGITLVTLLGVASIFAAAGWTGSAAQAAVLTVGTVVAIAASKAGDISQDLKTGYLVGATPARQQFGQLIGACFACWAVAATVLLLGTVYTFGSRDIPAPQATLMKTIIEGVLSGALPWDLVLTGAGVAFGGILCGVSGLAFAIGVYLPLSSMAAIYAGGCVRAVVDRQAKARPKTESDPGILAASGLVAGEGLAGVLVAGLVAAGIAPRTMPPIVPGPAGEIVALGVILLLGYFLYRAGRK